MSFFNEHDPLAFKPITENPIILDFSNCRYLGEIHLLLKQKFGLPEYYGENWDALWDCLEDRFDETESVCVEICGFMSLDQELREHCAAMFEVFDNVRAANPWVTFTRVS